MPVIQIYPIDVKIGDAGIPVQPFILNINSNEKIQTMKERIAQTIQRGPTARLAVEHMLMNDMMNPVGYLSNDQTANHYGIENDTILCIFRHEGITELQNGQIVPEPKIRVPPPVIPTEAATATPAPPLDDTIFTELSWRPIYDYLQRVDERKQMLQGRNIEANPASVFLDSSMLQYAGQFEAKRKLKSNKEFFEQKFFTDNHSFMEILQKMRQNLARNCTLVEQPQEREKNKILPEDTAQQVTGQEWTADQTLQKLQEMIKNSSFKGFTTTKEAGEAFIMEKATFLLYLAHKQRLEENTQNKIVKQTYDGSMIDLISGSDHGYSPEYVKKIEKDNAFTNTENSIKEATLASQLSLMVELRADPDRILQLLDSTVAGLENEKIGVFCSHSEGSYLLDMVTKKAVQYLLGSHSENPDTAKVLLWLGLLRGSILDLLHLVRLLGSSRTHFDLSRDLQLFLDGKRSHLLNREDEHTVLRGKSIDCSRLLASNNGKIMYDAKTIYKIEGEEIMSFGMELDGDFKKRMQFEGFSVNKGPEVYKFAAMADYLLIVQMNASFKPQQVQLVDKETLKVLEDHPHHAQISAIFLDLKKLLSIRVNDEPQMLYVFFQEGENTFLSKYDQSFQLVEPNVLALDKSVAEHQLVGIMGFGSFAAFRKALQYVYVSLESGKIVGGGELTHAKSWQDRSNPEMLWELEGQTHYKRISLPDLPFFCGNFLEHLQPKIVALSSQKRSEPPLSNQNYTFIISQLLASVKQADSSSLFKSPLAVWQSVEFYQMILDNIREMGDINKIEDYNEKAQEIVISLNFAQVLLNNLQHLVQGQTRFAVMMGSKEAAEDYFFEASSRVLAIHLLMEQLDPPLPTCQFARLAKIWSGFTKFMGKAEEEKLVTSSPEAILRLLRPVSNLPDAEQFLSAAPVLKLLSENVETVMDDQELLDILMDVVKGILARVETSTKDQTFKYVIRVVEKASRILLDKQPISKEEHEKSQFMQSKLLNFIRECFHICLDLISNTEHSSVQNRAAQATVLKMATLVRSFKDGVNLQLDFVKFVQRLDFHNVVRWIERYGQDILLSDCLQTLGMRICELVNFDSKNDTHEEDNTKSSTEDDDFIAKLVIQSSLLSAGIEDRFLGHLFSSSHSDENQLELIKSLELSTSIKILPDDCSPSPQPAPEHNPDMIQTMSTTAPLSTPTDSYTQQDYTCTCIINAGKEPIIDIAIELLQKIIIKKPRMGQQQYTRLGGVEGMQITRAAYAVMLKMSGMIRQFEEILEELQAELDDLKSKGTSESDIMIELGLFLTDLVMPVDGEDNIIEEWRNATKMRKWFAEYKSKMAEDSSARANKEAIDFGWSEEAKDLKRMEYEDRARENKIEEIVKKAGFLVMMQTPQNFKSARGKDPTKPLSNQKSISSPGLELQSNPSYFETSQEPEETSVQWKDTYREWKQGRTNEGSIKTEASVKQDLLNAGTESVLTCLQSSVVKIENIQQQVRTNYYKACKRLTGLSLLKLLCEKFFNFMCETNKPCSQESKDFIKRTVKDLLGWLSDIQKTDDDSKTQLLFHYMDDIKGCGMSIEKQLQEAFFSILENLGVLFSWSSNQNLNEKENYEFTRFLVSAFQWNYLARDFKLLHQRLAIFNLLYSGLLVHDITGKDMLHDSQFLNLWIDPRSQLSKDLLHTFQNLFLSVVKRITDKDVNQEVQTRSEAPGSTPGGMPTGPSQLFSLKRDMSKVDVSATSLLLRSAFNLIFRQLENFIYVSHALHEDENLCSSGKVKDCFFYLSLASGQMVSESNESQVAKVADEFRMTPRAGGETDYVVTYPEKNALETLPFKELPRLVRVQWHVRHNICNIVFHMSDGTSSPDLGNEYRVEKDHHFGDNIIGMIEIQEIEKEDAICRLEFFDREGLSLLLIKGSPALKVDVHTTIIGPDEKLCGFRINHKRPLVIGMEFNIAKAATGSEYEAKALSMEYDSSRNLQRFDPVKLKVIPDVVPQFRTTAKFGQEGKEDKRVTFPHEYEDCKSFRTLPTLKKIRYDTGSSIRCFEFTMSDGSVSDQIGGFKLKKQVSFEDKDIGSIQVHTLRKDAIQEALHVGRIAFYDRQNKLIVEIRSDMELSDLQTTVIKNDEKLAAFELYHTGSVISAVQFIIAKGNSVRDQNQPEVAALPRTICYDVVTKKLRQKYKLEQEYGCNMINSTLQKYESYDSQEGTEDKSAFKLQMDKDKPEIEIPFDIQQSQAKRMLMKQYRSETENDQLADYLNMIMIFTSAAQQSPYPLEMLNNVATPYHIQTLLKLLVEASPMAKLTILAIIKNLVCVKVPEKIFAEALKDLKSISFKVPSNLEFSNHLIQFLYNLALQIRTNNWESLYLEQDGGLHAFSTRLLQTIALIFKIHDNEEMNEELSNSFLHLLTQFDTLQYSHEDSPLIADMARDQEILCTVELEMMFEIMGSSLQTVVMGDQLVQPEVLEGELTTGKTCCRVLKNNQEDSFGHEINLKNSTGLTISLTPAVYQKFLQILKTHSKPGKQKEMIAKQDLHVLQAQICKFFILHSDTLPSKLSASELQSLSSSLFVSVHIESFSGLKPQKDGHNYAPWLFENAFARTKAIKTDAQDLPANEKVLITPEKKEEEPTFHEYKKQTSNIGKVKVPANQQLRELKLAMKKKMSGEDTTEIKLPGKKVAGDAEFMAVKGFKSKALPPIGKKAVPLFDQLKQQKNSLKPKMRIVREFMVQTGATLPEVVLSLLPRGKREGFLNVLKKFTQQNEPNSDKYNSFILESCCSAILNAEQNELETAIVDEFDFDVVAQELQRSQLLVEYKPQIKEKVEENIQASLDKFSQFKATNKVDALHMREAQIGEGHQFTPEDVEQLEKSMPPAALIHFLNIQLKRKLLNKVVYKFPEMILGSPKEAKDKDQEQEESKDENVEFSHSSFKLLWFTMQHFYDLKKCRESSNGVECVWQDPNGLVTEAEWQLLLFKVSKIPEVGHKIVQDLITRVIGIVTQEVNLFIQSYQYQVTNPKKQTVNSLASRFMAATDQESILKSMKMLDNILLVFCSKHDDQEWKQHKADLLFSPINKGPSIFASMMSVYMNLALNMFEFSLANPEGKLGELKPQLWLRRSALEACFRLLQIARTSSHDSEEILAYSIKPLFQSNLFKWLAQTLQKKLHDGSILEKDIFFYLCADLICASVRTFETLTAAEGVEAAFSIDKEILAMAKSVNKKKVLPESDEDLSNSLTFLTAMIKKQMIDTEDKRLGGPFLQTISEQFKKDTFDHTLTRILGLLNEKLDSLKAQNAETHHIEIRKLLEQVKAKLTIIAKIENPDDQKQDGDKFCNLVWDTFSVREVNDKTITSVDLCFEVLTMNENLKLLQGENNCYVTDPWRFDFSQFRENSLTCKPLDSLQLANNFFINEIQSQKIERLRDPIQNNQDRKPEIRINRKAAADFIAEGKLDNNETRRGKTIFTQVLKQLKPFDYKNLIKKDLTENQRPFRTYFISEGGVDDGGLMRETFAEICKELVTDSLPVLAPTANRSAGVGELRDCFVLNPNCGKGLYAEEEQEMLYFLGVLIGYAILSLQVMLIPMHPIFWKKVVGYQKLTEESDLQSSMVNEFKALNDVRKAFAEKEDEYLDFMFEDYRFIVHGLLPDERSDAVELCKGGLDMKLTRQNVDDYCKLHVEYFLNASSPQMKIVRKGIEFITTAKLVQNMGWRYAEERCCGRIDVNPDYLMRFTSYQDHLQPENSKVRQWFWEILSELPQPDRQLYIRFVQGQPRLPVDLNALQHRHTICGTKQRGASVLSLPQTDMCFFKVYLPEYPSKAVMKEKLVFAIRAAVDISLDAHND